MRTADKNNKFVIFLISLIPNSYVLESALPINALTPLIFACVFVYVGKYLYESGFKISKPTTFDFFIYSFIISIIIAIFITPNQSFAIVKTLNLIIAGISLIYFVRLFIKTNNQKKMFLIYLLINSLLLNLLVIQNFISAGMPLERFSFYSAHPIPVAVMASISILVSLLLFSKKEINFVFFLALIFSGAVVLFISSSRGPLLGLAITLLLMSPVIIKDTKKFILIIGSLLFSWYFISGTTQYSVFINRLNQLTDSRSSQIRLGLFNDALNHFSQSPIIGKGFGLNNYPHNIVLEFASQGGILLLLFLLVFILWLLKSYFLLLINRDDIYLCVGIGITILSLLVLSVSFTFVDLKFLYIGIGLVIITTKQLSQKEAGN